MDEKSMSERVQACLDTYQDIPVNEEARKHYPSEC